MHFEARQVPVGGRNKVTGIVFCERLWVGPCKPARSQAPEVMLCFRLDFWKWISTPNQPLWFARVLGSSRQVLLTIDGPSESPGYKFSWARNGLQSIIDYLTDVASWSLCFDLTPFLSYKVHVPLTVYQYQRQSRVLRCRLWCIKEIAQPTLWPTWIWASCPWLIWQAQASRFFARWVIPLTAARLWASLTDQQ